MPGKSRSMVARSICKLAAILIDGDDCRVWTGNVAEGEREGTAAGAEIDPDATAVPVDSMFDQLDVIGVVHQANPREGVDTERTWA